MYKPLALIGLMAVAGCAGTSAPPAGSTATASAPKYALNVPNMT